MPILLLFKERKVYTNIHPQTKTGCVRSPCKHGSCINVGNTYWCYCEPGYTGINCHIGKRIVLHLRLYFLLFTHKKKL